MCFVDQLPCGSVLTPAISCTKFKIHSAHADSPRAKTFFLLQFLGGTSLCFTDQQTQEENVLCGPTSLWVTSYTSYLLYKVQDPFSTCSESQGQNIFLLQFFWGNTLCFTDQQTQEENVLREPTSLWVSTYTSYLLCKVQDPFSTCSESQGQNIFLLQFGGTSLCFTDQQTQEENVLGGPTPLWVNTYTSYLL